MRFTGHRPDDPSKSGFSPDALLLTLELLPGDHALLLFGKVEATDKTTSLIARHAALPIADYI